MKKSLLFLLLAVLGLNVHAQSPISSASELEAGKAYTMKVGKGYVGTTFDAANKLQVVSDAAEAGKFMFVASKKVEDAYYIYSLEQGKFFTTKAVDAPPFADEVDGYFTITAYNNANYPNALRIRSSTTGNNLLVTNAPFTVILSSSWNSLDNGGDWNITEVEECELPEEAKAAAEAYDAKIKRTISSPDQLLGNMSYTMKVGKGYIGTNVNSAHKLEVVSDASKAGHFMFVASKYVDNAYYIYSVEHERFFTTQSLETDLYVNAIDGYFTISAYNNANYPFAQKITSSTTGKNMLVTNAPFTVTLESSWNQLDNGGDWNITEAEELVLPDAAQTAVNAFDGNLDPSNVIPLIPYPVSMTRNEGVFDLASLRAIYYGEDGMKSTCEGLANLLASKFGITVKVEKEGEESPAVKCDYNAWGMFELPEQQYSHYDMTVNADGIQFAANADKGYFYGIQTLRQLVETAKSPMLPYLVIADEPRFNHRGYMLDVARHFFNKDEVKQVLDIMAMYKLNVFHWHLTDDQGWRIEIPEYPKLTEVGAIRDKSLTSSGQSTTFYDDTEYGRGCYFTLDDLREIVAYAAERHITIIPEVDMPGHMVAALASYPEFSCDPTKKYKVRIDGGVSTDILDISNPEVIKFLKCVLGHLAEVFPGKLMHIGGDECPTGNWQASASCQAFAKEKGLTIDQLQGWLVEELGEWLRDNYGKDIVVWDELLGRWPDTNEIKPVIMAWTGIGYSKTAADRGMKSIIAPWQQMYIDFMQAAPADCDVNEGYFGGWSETNINTLDEIYNLNPTQSLSGKEEYCLGPQCNMWCETCCDFSQVLYQLLPRGLALAEIGWTPNENKNWANFLARLQSHDELFDAHGWPYGKHFFNQNDVPAAETALKEANEILAATQPGCAGYVSQEVYDDLLAAANALEAAIANGNDSEEELSNLKSQLSTFKAADIIQPDPAKTYQIVSASTYYKAKYAGSSVYALDGKVRFHYTPQLEPEELWQFEVADDGSFYMHNLLTDSRLLMKGVNADATFSEDGTAVLVKKATTPNGKYTYVPGALVFANQAAESNLLFADATGNVKTSTDGKLCCQGTWRLQEVTDYKLLLDRLVYKAELIILKRADGHDGEPTEEALAFLQNSLIDPALAETEVTADTYAYYMDIYAQYLAMPRMSFVDTLSEAVYYRIHNAYSGWANRYAVLNNGYVAPSTNTSNDNALWAIRKQGGSNVLLINKADGKQAYVPSAATDEKVSTADEGTVWSLSEYSSNESAGILIQAGAFSWYTNPNAWPNNIILKPIEWGASVWVFEPTDIETGYKDGVQTVDGTKTVDNRWYDLQGRPATRSTRGLLISNGKKICVK